MHCCCKQRPPHSQLLDGTEQTGGRHLPTPCQENHQRLRRWVSVPEQCGRLTATPAFFPPIGVGLPAVPDLQPTPQEYFLRCAATRLHIRLTFAANLPGQT